MVDGQNILFSTHAPIEPFQALTTITLLPQTLDGTVSAISSEGNFTTYTVTLAPYDLFPNLAVQPGQTTLLTNPNTVVVYADSNTQMLNSKCSQRGWAVPLLRPGVQRQRHAAHGQRTGERRRG